MSRKKLILVVLIVALLSLAISSTAGAATRKISLLGARGDGITQVVFTFKVDGTFPGFKGTAYSGGMAYDLACNLKGSDPDILLCRGHRALAGKVVQVVVNGFSFDTLVQYKDVCMSVYDVPAGPDTVWWDYGTFCMDQAELGDSVWLDSYYPGGIWKYTLMNGGFCGAENDYGLGWYWYPDYFCVN